MTTTPTKTLIIGAGPAGLAQAACLAQSGEEYIIVDQAYRIAQAWRNHYDRLHLHTPKSASSLPGLSFSKKTAKYPSRLEVLDYLDRYCQRFNIQPRFGTKVTAIRKLNDKWVVETSDGRFLAENLVMATGSTRLQNRIRKPGMDAFGGTLIHSADYKNGTSFRGKNVLVIGFGNSACEIAICLHEHGARPMMSVRSGVNILPRDVLGIPVLGIGKSTDFLPPRWVDKLTAPIVKMVVGSPNDLGLKTLPYGPKEQIVKYHQIPLLDIGTIRLIREGFIKVYGDITKIEHQNVTFEDGQMAEVDAIIMCTGYRHGLEDLMPLSQERLKDIRRPISHRRHFGQDNIYFIGFYISPNGMLREMGIEAKYITRSITKIQ